MPIADVDYEDYFPPERIDELEEAFLNYDAAGTGSISESRLRTLIREVTGLILSLDQTRECIREVDLDLNASLEFHEFVVLVIKLMGLKPRANLIDYREYLDNSKITTLMRLFARYDENDSGSIDTDQLQRICSELGRNSTPDQLAEILKDVDADGSGEIEFDEFCALFTVLSGRRKRMNYREFFEPAEVSRLRAVFSSFDRDGSGSVETVELDQLFRRMGHALKKEQICAILTDFDVDGSGSLDFDEFVAMIARIQGERRKRQINPQVCNAADLVWQENFSTSELVRAGFDAGDLRAAGLPASKLVQETDTPFPPLQLRRAGYSAEELRRAGLGPRELRLCGFSSQELRIAGFSASVIAEVNRSLHATFSRGDYSALPQLHPRLERSMATATFNQDVPRALTPTIREHTDWMPRMSANAQARQPQPRQIRRRHARRSSTTHDLVTDAKARETNLRRRVSVGY